MPRLPVVSLALAATLLLTACSAGGPGPAEPLPEGSVAPTSSPTEEPSEVAESPHEPCDDADVAALHALYPGEVHPEPTGDYYPDFLPLPSCVFEDSDFGQATVFFTPATEDDFETLEAAIVEEQGAGVPSDGQGLTTAGTVWEGERVPAIFLVPASFGVAVDYIAIRFEFP